MLIMGEEHGIWTDGITHLLKLRGVVKIMCTVENIMCTDTVCSFRTEQELEITRGDMDSDRNICKRKGRGHHHQTGVKEDYGE